MLNITRRRGERIVLNEDIFVSVLEVSGQNVRLGIEAPQSVRVYREELWLEIKAQNEAAVQAARDAPMPGQSLPRMGTPPPGGEGPAQGPQTPAGPGSQQGRPGAGPLR